MNTDGRRMETGVGRTGTETNKEVLIDFLNELVNKEHKIKDLTF